MRRWCWEISLEPLSSKARDLGQRSRLLEEMARSRYDLKAFCAAQQGQRLLVELDDGVVQATDD